ncbi:hypothetical protein BDV09DRAFT_200755, partial [Aspergillus tetrazonus]
ITPEQATGSGAEGVTPEQATGSAGVDQTLGSDGTGIDENVSADATGVDQTLGTADQHAPVVPEDPTAGVTFVANVKTAHEGTVETEGSHRP